MGVLTIQIAPGMLNGPPVRSSRGGTETSLFLIWYAEPHPTRPPILVANGSPNTAGLTKRARRTIFSCEENLSPAAGVPQAGRQL